MATDGSESVLPVEETTRTTRRRLLGELLGVLMLLALLNAGAIWALDRTDRGIQIIKAKWELVRGQTGPVDWLILGDSSGNQGLDPMRLGAALGGQALNACTLGDLALVDDAWLLDEFIEHNGPPGAVILVHAYDIWSRKESAVRSWLAVTPVEVSELAERRPAFEVRRSDRLTWALQKWMPLYGRPYRLRQVLRHPQRLWEPLPPITSVGFQEARHAKPDEVRRDLIEQAKYYRSHEFRASALNKQALNVILDLAATHDIDVFYAMSPLCGELLERPEFRSYLDSQVEFLKGLAEDYPRLHLVFTEPAVFDAEEMDAVDHVVGDAAAVYTEQVAAGVKAVR